MKNVSFNFGEIWEKFKGPLEKHLIWKFGISLLIALVLYAVVNIGLSDSEVMRHNSMDMHMLATELLAESGPEFVKESKEHAKAIRLYVDHIGKRKRGLLLHLLYPEYNYKTVLSSELQSLEKAATMEEAKAAIWQAGVVSNKLSRMGGKFSRNPFSFFKTEVLPDWLLTDLEDALAKSHEMVNKLEKEHNMASALASCRANREAILRLFLARLGYDDQQTIRKFKKDVKRAEKYTRIVVDEEEDEKTKAKILEWAESEARRAKILDVMLANKMDEACDLLREAIEKAFKKKEETKSTE